MRWTMEEKSKKVDRALEKRVLALILLEILLAAALLLVKSKFLN